MMNCRAYNAVGKNLLMKDCIRARSARKSSEILWQMTRPMSDSGFEMPPTRRFAKRLSTEFKIDNSGLLGVTRDMTGSDDFSESKKIIADMRAELAEEERNGSDDSEGSLTKEEFQPHKEPKTKLAEDLIAYIRMRGPITLHDYIAQTSNHMIHGYYQQEASKIGTGGDFVTSPEISQLFGEMIAVWLLSAWKALGSPKQVNLVELGPGKGTLMKDILRVCSQFPDFRDAVTVHMVEVSDVMRTLQRESVGCTGDISKTPNGITRMTNEDGIPISWYDSFSQVSNTDPILLVAQEFLDVFPVHQFVYTNKGWREKLVDVDRSMESTMHFRHVLSPSETPAARALLGEGSSTAALRNRENLESGTQTASSSSSSDAQAGLASDANGKLTAGDEIEISPLALSTIEYVSKRIMTSRGAVLLIDYGEEFTQGDSLRAFKKHSQVSIYSEPGKADITADVDFSLCKKTALKNGVTVHGSITQGEFLMSMGIVERVENLIELPSTSDETAVEIVDSFRRLVGDGESGLGKRFKVMAITDALTKIEGFGQSACASSE
jgi:NADH dehydrogenase [ubiquinone] 1 alpha subcomplex assembly factor 7